VLARGENPSVLRQRGLEFRTPEQTFIVPVTASDDMRQFDPVDLASSRQGLLTRRDRSRGPMVGRERHANLASAQRRGYRRSLDGTRYSKRKRTRWAYGQESDLLVGVIRFSRRSLHPLEIFRGLDRKFVSPHTCRGCCRSGITHCGRAIQQFRRPRRSCRRPRDEVSPRLESGVGAARPSFQRASKAWHRSRAIPKDKSIPRSDGQAQVCTPIIPQ